jgi:sphinganine-1-phosphate aldolase
VTNQPAELPAVGAPWPALRRRLRELKRDDYAWRDGRLPVYVYHHTDALAWVARQAFGEFFTESALGAGKAFPSVRTLEDEVVGMSLDLLGGGPGSGGTFTSGGTESIFLAVKAARDWAREHLGIRNGKIVVPASAHATVDKAASYLDVAVVRTPLRSDRRADVAALESAVDDRAFLILGSAPGYPHGVFDDIAALGAVAARHGIWLHVDACVGGFLAPFAREEGYPIPPFDLSVPGVRSLSADIHKYGFAAKGASVLLLADRADRRYQCFEFDGWPRGRYATDTFQGTRAAGPIASAWAVLNTLGRSGYGDIARIVMETTERLAAGIERIDGLCVIQPRDLCILLYESRDHDVDIYAVADRLTERGWFVGRSVTPRAIHVAVNPVIAPAVEAYLADLAAAVRTAREHRQVGAAGVDTY